MRFMLCLTVPVVLASTANAADGLNVYGAWLNAEKTTVMDITDCSGGPCGTLVWIDHPEPGTVADEENPDPKLRARPLLGLTILSGFEPRKDSWNKGRVYDPMSGNTYSAKLRRRDDGTLELKGCIGPLCRTQIWTPAAL